MTTNRPRIAIVGTFDVENFGDLLFPLIAQHELDQRLDQVEVRAYSYTARKTPDWPYEVRSVTELPDVISEYDALLVGGGFLIRFDKDVAPRYEPPTPAVHHPTGYWLTPAMIALAAGVPVVWNAPGMHDNPIPDWARPLVAFVIEQSAYVAVRDQRSREALADVADAAVLAVPDTAFGLGGMLAPTASSEVQRLRRDAGLCRPYVVVQAADSSRGAVETLRAAAHRFGGHQFLALPIGPVLGDSAENVADLPNLVTLRSWPSPLALAELVQGSEAVIGHSYHLAIAASIAGVPVFTPLSLDSGKYAELRDIANIHAAREFDVDAFAEALGRREVSPTVERRADALNRHWDSVATVVRQGRRPTLPAVGRLLQELPRLIEDPELRAAASAQNELATRTALEHRLDALDEQLRVSELRRSDAAAEHEQVRQKLERLNDLDSRRRATLAALQERAIEAGERLLHLEQVVEGQCAEIERAGQETQRLANETTQLRDHADDVAASAAASAARAAELVEVIRDIRALATDQHDEMASLRQSRSWRVTAPLRRLSTLVGRPPTRVETLQLRPLLHGQLQQHPFGWAAIDDILTSSNALLLADTFPRDHCMTVRASGGEKDYSYEARELVPFGKVAISHGRALHPAWQALVLDLLRPAYRQAVSALTGVDLHRAPLEVNATHYPVGGLLGPHCDLPDKLVTHVLYFNAEWQTEQGGCLRILGAPDGHDVIAELAPVVGGSVVLVRSDRSWHEVTPVTPGASTSRRAVTVTFHRPGSTSSMWPAGIVPDLHTVSGTAGG